MKILSFFKLKKTILSILLLSIMFTASHAIAFNINSDECITSNEFILEVETPTEHNDYCDIHHEFHNAFTLNQNTFEDIKLITISKYNITNLYIFKLSQSLLKPPTA